MIVCSSTFMTFFSPVYPGSWTPLMEGGSTCHRPITFYRGFPERPRRGFPSLCHCLRKQALEGHLTAQAASPSGPTGAQNIQMERSEGPAQGCPGSVWWSDGKLWNRKAGFLKVHVPQKARAWLLMHSWLLLSTAGLLLFAKGHLSTI